jgi:hypothetical protein
VMPVMQEVARIMRPHVEALLAPAPSARVRLS